MKQSAKTQLTIRIRQLTTEDLQTLHTPIRIEDGFLVLEKSAKGYSLKEPVKIPLEKVQAAKQRGLVAYVLSALSSERPKLIPFVFDNQSLLCLARRFLRHHSASHKSLYVYVNTIAKYSAWLDQSPDLIIQDVKPHGNIPDPLRVQNHVGILEDYIAALQDEGLSAGSVHSYAKHIRTFYRVNMHACSRSLQRRNTN